MSLLRGDVVEQIETRDFEYCIDAVLYIQYILSTVESYCAVQYKYGIYSTVVRL